MPDAPDLQALYIWLDTLPLSRLKRNISRDFSDALLFAEVIAYHIPSKIELHNYPAASSVAQKLYNWNTLHQKVLKKIGYIIPEGLYANQVQSTDKGTKRGSR